METMRIATFKSFLSEAESTALSIVQREIRHAKQDNLPLTPLEAVLLFRQELDEILKTAIGY